jgi:hypothetical protein
MVQNISRGLWKALWSIKWSNYFEEERLSNVDLNCTYIPECRDSECYHTSAEHLDRLAMVEGMAKATISS